VTRSAAAVAAVVAAAIVAAPRAAAAPPELGLVRWERDLDAALARARTDGRPVLVLFDEVPGCATCVGFGETALSHPLLVEAIEDEFIPVAVFNNVPGKDAELLARFAEPARNNPVVRFLDADGRDVIARRDGVWTTHGLAMRMSQALHAVDRRPSDYLLLAIEETVESGRETATFATACFWEGEVCLAAIDGVLATRPGHLDGREVVEVLFDSAMRSYAEVVRDALASECAAAVCAHDAEQERVARSWPATGRGARRVRRRTPARPTASSTCAAPRSASCRSRPCRRRARTRR
jgi:hypothetical protein